jgi:hypothetical protein
VTIANRKRTHDPLANKTVIYRATDAVVTIGFAGLAYVGDQPTDEWLAELLWGEPISRGPDGVRAVDYRFGQSPNRWNIGLAAIRIADAIKSSVTRVQPLHVTIAGWRWKRRRPHPILVSVCKESNSRSVRTERIPRHLPRGTNLRFNAIGVPIERGGLSSRFDRFRERDALYAEDAEGVFARFIRDLSAENPAVGVDVLSVALFKPGPGSGGVCLFRTNQTLSARIETPTRTIDFQGVAHTPWIVSSKFLAAPRAIIGRETFDLDGYSLDVVGGAPGGGWLAMSTSLLRPPPP